jgi:hypothetical protein
MTLVETAHDLPSDHVGELTLRRYRTGEFSVDKCTEIDEHLAGCPACRGKLRGLLEEQRAFEREISFERFVGGVERAARVPRTRPRRAWLLGSASLVAAAALALFVVRVSPSHPRRTNTIKGGEVEATLRVASAQGLAQRIVPPGSQEILEPGDRVRIGYRAAESRYLAAVSVDDQGVLTPLYPEAGPAMAVAASNETVFLPDSLEFTGTGRERVFLFLARTPFVLDAAKQAVRAAYDAAGGNLIMLRSPAFSGGQDVFSWLFSKP